MRLLLSRLSCRYTFSRPEATARLYESFALTEYSSSMDLLDAARQTSSHERRLLFFQHAQDELRHGDLFLAQAKKIRKAHNLPDPPLVTPDSEGLYSQLGETQFLTFVYYGENRGVQQFEIYLKHLKKIGDKKNAQVFAAIIADEERHRTYSLSLLKESCGALSFKRRIRHVMFWEARRRWKVFGFGIANNVFGWFAAIIVLIYAPIVRCSGKASGANPNDQIQEN